MPRGPDPNIWAAHFVSGSVQYHRRTPERPASISFMVQLDTPNREKGRFVEVRFQHQLVIAAFINEMVQKMREKGTFLPNKMG